MAGVVPKQTIPTRGPAASSEHRALWGSGPLLRSVGSGYGGRVIIEVWEDGRCLSVIGGGVGDLLPAALAALQSGAPLGDAQGIGAQSPMTGPHPEGAAFLGRIIVEICKDRPLVGMVGSDSRLLGHAVRHLTSLNRRP